MTISMRELQSMYFKFLPCSISSKDDSEPLQHAIFTYGDLKEVLASFDEAREMMAKSAEKKA